ncbi:MAG: glycosyltransferase [Planctomycetes bacterium]|jgi:hypothetical protein|nr:glycosyltransferase [Planctomycetota bacterium]
MSFETPVVLAIFNRPQELQPLWERVRQVRPKRLFVIADGPRPDRPGEAEQCAKARAITEAVDWDCDVERIYATENMGCGRRLSSGFDHVFGTVDRAIIIEDDCLPDPTFFPFCEQMLERYADDPRIMQVTGRGVFKDPPSRPYSYYFTRQLSSWGWASWARAWKHYDFQIKLWPDFRDERWVRSMIDDDRGVPFFMHAFDHAHYDNQTWGTWAQQFNFAVWSNNGLAVRSHRNLVEYRGLDRFTHKLAWGSRDTVELPVHPMPFPLQHPPGLVPDKEADRLHHAQIFSGYVRQQRIQKVRRPLGRIKRALLPG